MRRRLLVISGLIVTVAITSYLAPAAAQRLMKDRNVVANRLEGKWVLDEALAERLGSKGRITGIEFTSDPSVAYSLPDLPFLKKILVSSTIYKTGYMTMSAKEDSSSDLIGKPLPYILVTWEGNPQVIWFRERGGDPMGDAESNMVSLAVAKDTANDVLFIGDDLNPNSPFIPFSRAASPAGE